jgi:nucleoside-diphosphate-sugar epimerase
MDDPLRGADVLVTGATGFLGSHVTRRLVGRGASVHVLVREASTFERLTDILPALRIATADLTDVAAVRRCVSAIRPRFVFHLAGVTAARRAAGDDPSIVARTYDVNISGTLALLSVLSELGQPPLRVVRTGGIEEYGSGPLPYREDQREAPVSHYSASQVAATHMAQMLWRQTGLPIVTLRPALLYGPQQPASFFIPGLILSSLAGRAFEMTTGEQTRDLLYVEDAVDAVVDAATAPGIDGDIINIGSGREYRIRDVAELIVRLAGAGTLRFGAVRGITSGLDRLVCDPAHAQAVLRWSPRTSLEDGLQQTIASFRAVAPPITGAMGSPA